MIPKVETVLLCSLGLAREEQAQIKYVLSGTEAQVLILSILNARHLLAARLDSS